ncbi:MAG: glycerol-3-phosphate 1-O-acyltransferase PlsY [Ignavibacteria bacterium]
MLIFSLIIVLSYLIGSIPNSIIISRAVKGIDIREHGSGNAGGTNVMRVLGWKHGLLVILLDALKGVVVVVFVARLFYYGEMPFKNATPFDDFTFVQFIAGIFAVIGHVWTVFAGFKGGKGIATAMGMLIMVATIDILIAMGVFTLVVLISRYVSLGSIIGAITVPLALIIRENVFNSHIHNYGTLLPFVIILSVLVVYTHRKNLIRILSGKENKLSFSKKKY